ncbi:MAG: hypothetical protein AMXMBFR84_24180 [Candidatus Hydrogenedentota bacterium]
MRAELPGGDAVGLCLVNGALTCYTTEGTARWTCHPAGLNFEQIIAVRDLNKDGSTEVLLQAGRPTPPYGAAALVSLNTGELIWRYDVDPMSYQWYAYAGSYLPNRIDEQIVVIMMGYPPDKDNGYITLFEYADGANVLSGRWRYEFSEYTCFPTFHQTDLEGDGVRDLVVQSHSRMWVLDAVSGAMKHFAKWDVAPANVRSYGLTEFVDLNRDGLDDFLCIGTFALHHEVLLNRGGAFEKAWHQGWAESVTTGKVASVYPVPAYADCDDNDGLEIVVSMYNAEDESAWLTRIYDAVSGELRYRVPNFAAVALHDVDGDGDAEILGNMTHDPTRTAQEGAAIYECVEGGVQQRWSEPSCVAVSPKANAPLCVESQGAVFAITYASESKSFILSPWERSNQKQAKRIEFAAIPESLGPPMPTLLAANLVGDARNELLLWSEPLLRVLSLDKSSFVQVAEFTSSALPALADFNGDGALDLATCSVDPSHDPIIEVVCPSQGNATLWKCEFPAAGRPGLPQPRQAYLRTGHFTGKSTPDLYVWAGTPIVRSAVIEGTTGSLMWDKGETPGLERYWGASVNLASVYDFNTDGKEDLVFTNPDYYCVADGPTGNPLFGPAFPPEIFNQPCQGLYTLPAILTRDGGQEPWVALVSGHYFQAVMTLHSQPLWHSIPAVGEHAPKREGFIRLPSGAWFMGEGRQDGRFVCVDVETGRSRWEMDTGGSLSEVIANDVDGDGNPEFVFGTSHGDLYAIHDKNGVPETVWKMNLGSTIGSPIAADLDGNGRSEIAVCTADGRVVLLDRPQPPPEKNVPGQTSPPTLKR